MEKKFRGEKNLKIGDPPLFLVFKKYGGIGKDFIHVHHIVPISKPGEKYEIDPINDLIPVCPNCHSMLHTTNPPLKIEKLRKSQ
ncbi:MAG: HNH endonuclease [Saprospiraceae bacterium]|nr:HNH endonuclease [Saprospiraceae bacterium]